jgi:antitoxin PrlF
MQQRLTHPIATEIHATVSSKGQITIPLEIRKHLGVGTHDKIAFVVKPQGTVEVKTPKYRNLASLKGAAGTLKKPLSWKKMKEIVRDDVAQSYAKKFQ